MTTTNTMNTNEANSSKYQISDFLTAEQFQRLESVMYARKFQANTTLFWEGDPADKLFYVKSGQVKIYKTTEDGKELILYILQKGDLFGELGGLSHLHYSFNAVVTKDADIGVVQTADLEVLIYQNGEFAVDFMKWMGLTHRTTQSKFRDLLLYGKPGALASTLVRMSNSYGQPHKNGVKINVKLTNTELAQFIGTTRESVNRLLSGLKDEGVIDYDKNHIVICNLTQLKCIAGCPSFPACPKEVCRI
ncbi:Crp/Fnr family transcriptional regulator [Paenibacillus turpanensis]|uniref:Crp/Fnr family transcriptional regulator n=1 Tax=Paenibacillus turpanensis TaxID=2689078 RepID=UPI001FB6C1B5|nr:Crp/Fnr family transcriptional regulator [Paenibacillus turpanensis]